MKRVLKIEKFRNIGLRKSEQLVLNQSMEKGKIGNLIVLVGANNSGKSNVLDALDALSMQEIENRDVTTLSYDVADHAPILTLSTYDNKEEYSYSIIYGKDYIEVTHPVLKEKTRIDTDQNNINLCNVITSAIQRYKNSPQVISDLESFRNSFENESASKKYDAETSLMELVDLLYEKYDNGRGDYYDRYVWESVRGCGSKLIGLAGQNVASVLTKTSNQFKKEYGVKMIPSIVRYDEKVISNENLVVKHDGIENDYFFKKVLGAIDMSVSEVKSVYTMFKSTNTRGCLSSFQAKVNKKLKKVANDFNKLYYVDDGHYSFEMAFESDNIYFSIMRNGEGMPLDYQSTGFRWFFNLYFNLLVNNELETGDIIIMDEPATNLHVQGQCELRKFLKEFAIKNDITIILATHSPFLIDLDYLDELRVVSIENNISSISNDFSTIDLDDPDSLKPVKNALTVSNYILTDPDKKVVFVEGITDYNYMIAFKKYFKIDDVVFLPIKGVGNGKKEDIKQKQYEISKALLKIRKHGPILMVDGDKAGVAMKNNNNDVSELDVFTLKDVDEKFKEIESLFTTDDLQELGLVDKSGKVVKHSGKSAVFKTYTDIANTVSQETIANFKKVFDHIEKM